MDGSTRAGSEAGSGSNDSGPSTPEGGDAVAVDAAAPSNDGGVPAKTAGGTSGCGCATAGDPPRPVGSVGFAGLVGLALIARRRRRLA
jgi:MYXO-CTERM domain-containing protein